MSILLDHCIPRRYLCLLREWGYTTSLLTDHLVPDSPDSQVIQLADQLDAVLLTLALDFANILDYPPASHAGIVVLRYDATQETLLDAALQQALTDLYRDALRGVLVIVEPTRYRVRHQSG